MSNQKEQNPVTIDVMPESKPKSSRLALIIAGLALVSVLGALFAAYHYTQKAAQELASINAKIERNVQAQEGIKQQLETARDTVAQQSALLQEQQRKAEQRQQTFELAQQREAELSASLADVRQRIGASTHQWMLAEAEYLLRIANHRLLLARDIHTARTAMQLADERLRDTQAPEWHEVREQIALDLAKLDEVKLPDISGISARLTSLIEQTPQLQLNSATIGVQPTEPESVDTSTAERNWHTLLDDLWQGFKGAIRIRRNDQPIPAMLPPEQQFFLYENLRQQFEVTRLAVSRSDADLYRDSLQHVAQWLRLYFDSDHQSTQRMLQSIDELASIDIRPTLPKIHRSLSLLLMQRKPVANPVPPMPANS